MKNRFHLSVTMLFLVLMLGMSAGYRKQETGRSGTDPQPEKYPLDSTVLSIETTASHLNVPWEIIWGPDNWIWFTEQDGKVRRLNPKTGKIIDLLQIEDYYRKRLGLMSMVLHPDWKNHPQVFINYTHIQKDSSIVSKLVRYTYAEGKLANPLLLYQIPGYLGHNGSRLVISKDRKLLWATGDLKQKETILNPAFNNGKILRLNLDGTIPADNPFPGSPVWSMGFRVPQGLVYTRNGNLFSAEHGDATDDEVNLILKGANYGWPYIAGFCDHPDEEAYCKKDISLKPVKAWTPTIAPAGMDYYDGNIPEWKNALLLTTLKDQSLRILRLDEKNEEVVEEQIHFSKKFGRLRDVCVSPSGDIYISTSNRDWNPPADFPIVSDDRIIRIYKSGLIPEKSRITKAHTGPETKSVSSLYASFCESCHKADGRGVPGSFPSLVSSAKLSGDKSALVKILLKGSQARTGEQMPSFSFMTDAQLAEVASYARLKFANAATPVSATEVAEVRMKER